MSSRQGECPHGYRVARVVEVEGGAEWVKEIAPDACPLCRPGAVLSVYQEGLPSEVRRRDPREDPIPGDVLSTPAGLREVVETSGTVDAVVWRRGPGKVAHTCSHETWRRATRRAGLVRRGDDS